MESVQCMIESTPLPLKKRVYTKPTNVVLDARKNTIPNNNNPIQVVGRTDESYTINMFVSRCPVDR